jgi:hypothetical protein
MQPDARRTITFNPRPEDEAQFRSARLGSYVVGWLLGMPAVICLAVARVHNLWWAFSIGGSPLEQLKLCLISLAMAGVIGGLPVACQTARNVDPQSASKTDPALREGLGSLGAVIAEICGAASGSTPTDSRVLLPSWSGDIR